MLLRFASGPFCPAAKRPCLCSAHPSISHPSYASADFASEYRCPRSMRTRTVAALTGAVRCDSF